MAPQVGFEPTTCRLTAECSTAELLRNVGTNYNNFLIFQLAFFEIIPHQNVILQYNLKMDKVISPCISICKTDPSTGLCYGCGRSIEEKSIWRQK